MNLRCLRQVNLAFFPFDVYLCDFMFMFMNVPWGVAQVRGQAFTIRTSLLSCLRWSPSCPQQSQLAGPKLLGILSVPSISPEDYWHCKQMPPGLAFMWDLGI